MNTVRFRFIAPNGRAIRVRSKTWFSGRAIAMARLGCGMEIRSQPIDLGPFAKQAGEPTKKVYR